MKKLLLLLVMAALLTGCSEPILNQTDYVIIDTIGVDKHLGSVAYHVIIKIDGAYFYGTLDGFYSPTPFLSQIKGKIHTERIKKSDNLNMSKSED